jgi:hypothetical protein
MLYYDSCGGYILTKCEYTTRQRHCRVETYSYEWYESWVSFEFGIGSGEPEADDYSDDVEETEIEQEEETLGPQTWIYYPPGTDPILPEPGTPLIGDDGASGGSGTESHVSGIGYTGEGWFDRSDPSKAVRYYDKYPFESLTAYSQFKNDSDLIESLATKYIEYLKLKSLGLAKQWSLTFGSTFRAYAKSVRDEGYYKYKAFDAVYYTYIQIDSY